MITYFSDIYHGLISLFIGMGITFKEFFSPTVTVSYPYETLTMCDKFRGHTELIASEEGKPNCVVCGLCERACPSNCISLAGEKPEGEKKVNTIFQSGFFSLNASITGLPCSNSPSDAA